ALRPLPAIHARALGDVRAPVSRRDAAPRGAAVDCAARGALEGDELRRRLLLRGRVTLPPLALARAPRRRWCRDRGRRMTRGSAERAGGHGSRFAHGRRALTAIAVFKLCKATLLVAAGIGLVGAAHGDTAPAA